MEGVAGGEGSGGVEGMQMVAAPTSDGGGGGGGSGGGGEKPAKRMMKSPYQLEVLERTYAESQYPSEEVRAELSVQLGLTDRQLQMWFCHRRLKDRKPAASTTSSSKRGHREEEPSPPVMPLPTLLPQHSGGEPMVSEPPRRGTGRAVPRIGPDVARQRYYEPPPMILAPPLVAPIQLTPSERRLITMVESQLGEPLREDGPVLGVDFDPLPPGAFGTPLEEQPIQHVRPYESSYLGRHDLKLLKEQSLVPSLDHSYASSSISGKRKHAMTNSHSHAVHPTLGSKSLHEYQFLPEQPSVMPETYDRSSRSLIYDSSIELRSARLSPLPHASHYAHGGEPVAPSYAYQCSSSTYLAQPARSHVYPSVSPDYDSPQPSSSLPNTSKDGHFGMPQASGLESPYLHSERAVYHEEESSRIERKRKSDEARIKKEVEAHERRIKKELELKRKREEQTRKEMEKHDRERRKEEERLLKERHKEQIRFQREQRREYERMEKFLQKESRRAEKMRQKEELRREKEAARQKAANERATARRLAREYMELVEDERLELMELAAHNKGLPSMLYLDIDTLEHLDSFRDMLCQFPPESVRLKQPFAIHPWNKSDENVGKLLMVWKFLFTFADILGLWSFTLDEFVQSLHDNDSRLLGQVHVALLKSIIKDIEDVSRTPSSTLGANQSSSVNQGGGHPQVIEGAYAWGFSIRNWQRNLNSLTWPEVFRQFALAAGFGPQLKKRIAETAYYRDDNEGHDGEDVISTLRNGSAVVNAVALMKERGYTNKRRSRHRLTPGTVKFAAFHVLSLEGSRGLTILEVADKIQRSGLRDLTTSKTPEASIAAALSRDTKLFERTAPSTYCVRSPYRKDPLEAEVVLSSAREKVRAFQNVVSDTDEAEKDNDDGDYAERDDDSECEDAEDDPDCDDMNIDRKVDTCGGLARNTAQEQSMPTPFADMKIEPSIGVAPLPNNALKYTPVIKTASSFSDSPPEIAVASSYEACKSDLDGTEIDESNHGESWVEGLTEGDYSELSVQERLNALVALMGVAMEGNSIRLVLEERLEAANALKKQMWAEAQTDKRRQKEEVAIKIQYNSCIISKQENSVAENNISSMQMHNTDQRMVNHDDFLHQQSQITASERNGLDQDINANADALLSQQYANTEKTRAQLKSYIGHKAEQLYVYRSLPLGQDRRRNRYWQFSTSSTSPTDPCSGIIFFESRDGLWRVIDTEEAFDALMNALDTRGVRESHLHSMLQRIEPMFKEAHKRKRSPDLDSSGRLLKNGSAEMISGPNCSKENDDPGSSIYSLSPDIVSYSDSFNIELGRNEAERHGMSRRGDVFLRWMWEECYNPQAVSALKHGKRRCPETLRSCHKCFQIYFPEERHCPSCHKTFRGVLSFDANFSEHMIRCQEKQNTDPNWRTQTTMDDSVSVGIRLLKAQLAVIEASIPAEALLPHWLDSCRRSWAVNLHSATSLEEILRVITQLEGSIRRDYLSSDYETAIEMLNPTPYDIAGVSAALMDLESVSTPPWLPRTIAAVAFRLAELDSAISYTLQQKLEAAASIQKEAGNVVKIPSRAAAVRNAEDLELPGPAKFDLYHQERMLNPGSGRGRGRGRGTRGRGGRGRGRGGRPPKAIGSSSRGGEFRDDAGGISVIPYEKPRKYTKRGGGTRGRGSKRGRRSARPRQLSEGETQARSIPRGNLLGSFGELSTSKRIAISEPGRSAPSWSLAPVRPYVQDDGENSSESAPSERSDDDNSLPMEEEYDNDDDRVAVQYNSGYFSSAGRYGAGEESEDEDGVGEGDNDDGDEYDGDRQAEDDEDDDAEMDDDDDNIVDDDDDGRGAVADNHDDDGAMSYSSEFSDE